MEDPGWQAATSSNFAEAAPAPLPTGQTPQREYRFSTTTAGLRAANESNGVEPRDANTAPAIVKAVLADLEEQVALSRKSHIRLCRMFKLLSPGLSNADVALHYRREDDLPSDQSSLPFPFQNTQQIHRLQHFFECSDVYSANSWSNLIYSNVIGDTLFEAVRKVNVALGENTSHDRFNLMFDAPWTPGHFQHKGDHQCSKQSKGCVPGGQILDDETGKPVMLKPDMFITKKRSIDLAFLLSKFKSAHDDWSDLQKLLMEGVATLAARDVYLTGLDAPVHTGPLMWLPLLYCSGPNVRIYLMWMEIDRSDNAKLCFPYVQIRPSSGKAAFNLKVPRALLEFTKLLIRLADKVAEQTALNPEPADEQVILYKHGASCSRSNKRKRTSGKGKAATPQPPDSDDDDDDDFGDGASDGDGDGGRVKKSKQQPQKGVTTRGARQGAQNVQHIRPHHHKQLSPRSKRADAEALVMEWGAKSFEQINALGRASNLAALLAGMFGPRSSTPRHPVNKFFYADNDRVTVVKFFYHDRDRLPEDIQEEVDIQSAMSELPAAHVPRILRVKQSAAFTAVEMEYAGDSRQKAYNWQELKSTCRQLLSAMDAVHTHGYVHCDLKPDNVALRRNSGDGADGGLFVSILDWGCAMKLEPGESSFEGDGRGTDGFMAPEMADHEMCTSAIDIYSLGLTFDYFAGRLPRDDEGHAFEWEAFEALVRDMTHADPMRRPTAVELLNYSFLSPDPQTSHP